MNYEKIKLTLILTIAIILTIVALFLIRQRYQVIIVTIPSFQHQVYPNSTDKVETDNAPQSEISNQKSKILNVPFTPQAPTANWDQLHNEACEEASAIMSAVYFNAVSPSPLAKGEAPSASEGQRGRTTNLDPSLVESEISKLTTWQDQNFGYHLDTTSAETAKMIREVYGLQTQLLNNFTADNLKKALAEGKLAAISENGRLLGNPYYKQPGPVHHMLLIKGYNGDNFITNDSGTKRGLNYAYDFETIYNAAADWDHGINNVNSKEKTAIIIWK